MDIREQAAQEAEAFQSFREKYAIQFPPPKMGRPEGLGLRFVGALVWAMSAVILAALRTIHVIYEAAELSGAGQFMSRVEAGAVLFAIEGGMVIAAVIRASHTKKYDPKLLGLGLFLMLGISTMAGLGQSFSIVQGISQRFLLGFQYVLSFTIGIGATLVTWVSGEIVGAQIARVLDSQDRVEERYEQDLQAWNEALIAAWNASAERKIVRKDLRVSEAEAQAMVRSASRSALFRGTPVEQEAEQGPSYSEQVYDWLDAMAGEFKWSDETEVPSAREIIRRMGQNIPPSSAQRGRNRWIRERMGR